MKKKRKKKWVVLNPEGVIVTIANQREKAINNTIRRGEAVSDWRDMRQKGYTVEEVRV